MDTSFKLFRNRTFLWTVFTMSEILLFAAGHDRLPVSQLLGLALLGFAVFLWSTEIFPLYASSLLVVTASALILGIPKGLLPPGKSYQIFYAPFADPVIILFFGGFVLARALQKYALDAFLATTLLGRFGRSPSSLLLGLMLSTGFISMWMSNTAAAAMMLAVAAPILSGIRKDNPLRKSLVLGIAFGANIGGIATPIGTPPNAIAIGFLQSKGQPVDFVGWVLMAFPLAVVLMGFSWAMLMLLFPPSEKCVAAQIKTQSRLSGRQKSVLALTACTLLLWLTSGAHHLPSSLIGLASASMLFASGLLRGEDLKEIEWEVLILMWGGLALGEVVAVTGLADRIAGLPIPPNSQFTMVAVMCFVTVLISTFMSNTATANIMVPVVMSLPVPSSHRLFLAVTVALSCSMAMALPISTPPNAIAFSAKELKTRDLFKAGLLVSVAGLALILAGYRMVIPLFLKAIGD